MDAVSPMLAKAYAPDAARFPALVQPKLDGVRMLVSVDAEGNVGSLRSRTGKSFDHLRDRMFPSSSAKQQQHIGKTAVVLDGELYAHGLGFQAIVSAVKNRQKVTLASSLRYHVYDVVDTTLGYAKRNAILRVLVEAHPAWRVELVPTERARSAADVERLMERWHERGGYEGVMVRDAGESAAYEPGKRSATLLKLKRFDDAEFEIVDVETATGKDAGTAVFVCRVTNTNKTFRARPLGTLAERRKMLRDRSKLIGKPLTVRYQGLTDDGIPRFPVGVAVRVYE
jgi:DNA ligase-1